MACVHFCVHTSAEHSKHWLIHVHVHVHVHAHSAIAMVIRMYMYFSSNMECLHESSSVH